MKARKRRFGRRAWLMRAAVMGAAIAFSAGAPAVGAPAAAAGVAAASAHAGEQVFRLGNIGICWASCPGYGWCCYFNPRF